MKSRKSVKFARSRRSKSARVLSKPEAKAVAQVARRVVKSNQEKKYFLQSTFSAAVSVTPDIGSISDVPQATTDEGRIGDQLTLRSIEVRLSAITSDTTNLMRFIVFQWYPNTTPVADDVLIPNAVLTSNQVYAPYNHDKRFMFRILYDRTMQLDTYNPAFATNFMIKKFPRSKIQYQLGGTTGQNKIYVLKVSDSTVTTHPTMNTVYKLNYSDA